MFGMALSFQWLRLGAQARTAPLWECKCLVLLAGQSEVKLDVGKDKGAPGLHQLQFKYGCKVVAMCTEMGCGWDWCSTLTCCVGRDACVRRRGILCAALEATATASLSMPASTLAKEI